MSAPNPLTLVFAANSASAGKPATPQAAEAAADNAPPFASVLQQKIQRNESKPAQAGNEKAETPPPAGKAAEAASPASTKVEAEVPAEVATPAEAPLNVADALLPWLNGLGAQGAALPQNAAPAAVAASTAPTQDTLNLLAGQSIAGLVQAASQVQNALPANVSKTGETAQGKPQSAAPLITTLISGDKGDQTAQLGLQDNLSGQAASESANLAAESLSQLGTQGSSHARQGGSEADMSNFAQTLASLQSADKTPAIARPQAVVNSPVGSEAWPQEMGERLVWMSNRQESRAELILTPAHMGKIEISLNISGDQASVSFVSANPQVREALEAAMNRLRDVLAESGINLGQTNVGAESSSQWAQQQKNGDNESRTGADPALADGAVEPVRGGALNWQARGNGMVDVFA